MNAVQLRNQKTGDIAERLLSHYHRNARDLPWRAQPGTALPDPYRVWLSEIMLQQTTVAAVIPYFLTFTTRWPDFEALAAADESDVMAAWAGLGYYARARNLVACARAVVADHQGRLPADEASLLKLPGIGSYTAAAIAAMGFGQRSVVVDANVERVVARLFAIASPLPAGKRAIWSATDSITPDRSAGDFAQAMMDLGARICSVRAPSCPICPLLADCAAGLNGNPEAYPVKPAKKAKPHRRGTAYWIQRDRSVWLVRREGQGMLGGMRALPGDDWSARVDGSGTPPFDADWQILPQPVEHVFTHFSLSLTVAVTALPVPVDALGDGEYWPVNSLDKAGLPTLFVKASKAVMALGER